MLLSYSFAFHDFNCTYIMNNAHESDRILATRIAYNSQPIEHWRLISTFLPAYKRSTLIHYGQSDSVNAKPSMLHMSMDAEVYKYEYPTPTPPGEALSKEAI